MLTEALIAIGILALGIAAIWAATLAWKLIFCNAQIREWEADVEARERWRTLRAALAEGERHGG